MHQYYLLGRSGLRVSRLALGTMNFGVDGFHAAYGKTEERGRADLPPLPGVRRQLHRHRRLLHRGRERDDPRPADRPGRRPRPAGADQQVHQQRRPVGPERRRQRPQAHHPRRGGVAAPAAAPTTSTCTCCTPGTGSPPSRRSCAPSTTSCGPGKIRYAGLSDVPAWYAARAQSYAEAHALTPMVTVQLPYSLVDARHRTGVRADGPGARHGPHRVEPVGGGLLTGKYRRGADGLTGDRPAQHPGRRPQVPCTERLEGDRGAGVGCRSNWAVAWPRWRSTGWSPSPASPPPSSAPAASSSSTATSRRWTSSCPPTPGAGSTRRARRQLALPYAMFTPQYQSWIVSPGLGIGDKPAGYAPPVFNGTLVP